MYSISHEQLKMVGLSCPGYESNSFTSASDTQMMRSCETCEHWNGKKCTINYFDKVLEGLDQG